MKVVYLAAGAEETLGGETRVAMELSMAMKEYADIAIVFTGRENRIYEEDGIMKVSLEGGWYGGEELGVFNTETISFFFDFLDSFKPDIVHSHSAWLAPFIAQVWALQHKIPYIYTTHVLASKISEFFEVPKSSLIYRMMDEAIFKKYFLGYMDNCSTIIALNEIAFSETRDYGYKGDMEIIPNGRFLKQLNEVKLQQQSSKERVLIFVGSVTKRKNQEFLLKVMDYLPKNFKLILIGRFLFEDYEKEFRRKASKYSNVEVTGGVDPSTIPTWLEKSHIFVSSSTVEVQALSVIEALAAGRPIVGLSNETIDELIDSKVGIALPKDASPKEFAKSVLKISKLSQSDYTAMCEEGRERVKILDWHDIAQRTYNLYEKYVGTSMKEGGNWKKVRGMILNLPSFPGQKYLLERYDYLKATTDKSSSLNVVNRVPKKTLLFAGITVGLAVAIFAGLKVSGYLKKSVKKRSL